jgi:hypothetical protein
LVKSTLEKTPVWGKPVREREFFLFLQIWKLHISKNKTNSLYLSLPSIFVLEIHWKKPNSCNLEICALTAVPYGLYGFFEKRAQKFTATVWWSYGLYGLIKSSFFFDLRAALRPEQVQ